MKIVVGERYLIKEAIFTFKVKIFAATGWTLDKTDLSTELSKRAVEAAGIEPNDRKNYRTSLTVHGSGNQNTDEDDKWVFEVKVQKLGWREAK